MKKSKFLYISIFSFLFLVLFYYLVVEDNPITWYINEFVILGSPILWFVPIISAYKTNKIKSSILAKVIILLSILGFILTTLAGIYAYLLGSNWSN